MRRFIIFLVRRRLGLGKYEFFQFVGQKSDAIYYFSDETVMKLYKGHCAPSGVSLHWLLHDDCKVRRYDYIVSRDVI